LSRLGLKLTVWQWTTGRKTYISVPFR